MELLGRFRVERLLKDGGGVRSWLAWDGDDPVVVKVTDGNIGLSQRLAHEAEALATLKSDAVQLLREYGTQDDSVFLVTDYLPGETLKERLDRGPLSLNEFYEMATCLLETLVQVHGAGILHRDIKPDNVVLLEGRAKLIDFGLCRSQNAVGTVLYAAPETSGLLQRDVTETADLYSLGALFFHSLTGSPPFLGASAGDVLRQHLSAPVPTLRIFRSEVPDSLQIHLERLLAKEPQDRYSSADEALSDLRGIAGGKEPNDFRALQKGRLVNPKFIGRQRELAAVLEFFPAGGCIILEAPSGGGKSRLLDALARECAARGALVLRGQALYQCGAMPFQLLAAPVYAAAANTRLATSIHEIAELWGEDLAQALPGLREILGPPKFKLPEETAQSRLLQAMYALLASWTSVTHPVLLLLDDVQWADPNSLELLAMLGRGGSPLNLMVVAACRNEEIPNSLKNFEGFRLKLPALDPQESRELLESMGGTLPRAAWEWLEDFAGGNPFLLIEGLRGLSLRNPDERQVYQTSARAVTLLRDRLKGVGPEAYNLLVQAAVLGRSFRLQTLATMVGLSAGRVLPLLESARRTQLLWSNSEGTYFTLAHDRLRESLLELSLDSLPQLHLRAARALEADPESSSFELAFHFQAGERSDLARPHALKAARMSRAQYQFSLAVDFYQMSDFASPAIREELAESLFYSGRVEESLATFQVLSNELKESLPRGRCLKWMGEICYRLGRYPEALRYLKEALVCFSGGNVARPSMLNLVSVAARCFLRGPAKLPEQKPLDERETLQVQAYEMIGNTVANSLGIKQAIFYLLTAADLSHRFAIGAEICQQWGLYACVLTHLPGFRGLAKSYSQAVPRLVESHSIPELTAVRALARTVVYSLSCEPLGSAIPRFLELLPRLQRTGDLWEWSMNASVVSLALNAYGAYDEMLQLGKSLHQTLLGLNQPRGRMMAVYILARASSQPVPESDLDREAFQFSSDDSMARLQLRTAYGIFHLRRQEWQKACEMLRKPREERTVPGEELAHEVWLCEALRTWADHLPVRSARRRELYLEAYKQIRASLRKSQIFCPFFLTRIYRELGLVQLALGKVNQGLESLQKGLDRSLKFDHFYEAAVIQLELARWRLDQGEAGAGAEKTRALRDLKRMGALWHLEKEPEEGPTSALLPIRPADFGNLLSWGNRLTQGLEPFALGQSLCAAIQELLPCTASLLPVEQKQSSSLPILDSEQRVLARLQLSEPPGGLSLEQERLIQFLAALSGSAWGSALRHQDLLRSERRWSQAFEGAHLGLALLGRDGGQLQSNRYFQERLGAQALELGTTGTALGQDGNLHWLQLVRVDLPPGQLVTVADVTHRHLEQLARLQEAERRLFGLELHDSVLGELAALKLRLESESQGASALQAARSFLQEMSWLAFELRNPVAEGRAFYPSFRHYLQQFSLHAGIQVQARLIEDNLPDWQAMILYRILQSVLNGFSKHAVGRVQLRMKWTSSGLLVRVEGDTVKVERWTIPGLKFRLGLLGGRMRQRGAKGLHILFPGLRAVP